MLIEILIKLFKRDLNKLRQEIELYNNEQNIWLAEKQITNTAGNLCLHLIGNLNGFIGAVIGKTGYIRHREREFSLKNIPREELLKSIDETILVVESSLTGLTDDELNDEFPIQVFEEKTTTGYMITHLATHLAYHLGQINYHRRLLDDPSA